MQENNVAIKFDNVSIFFGQKQALKNVSFEIKKGEFHGFIGANGAGKTTSFRSLLGFYPFVKGEIMINGISFKDDNARKLIGYVPEVATFPTKLNIFEYLVMLATFYGIEAEEAKKRVSAWLEKLNIGPEIYKRKGKTLSSGQQKKIMLVQALIHEPQILILDEPAANLDPKIRVELYENLKELQKEGKTIFVSSHILSELEQYIDSYTVLDMGEVIDTGLISEKKKNIAYPYLVVSQNTKPIIELFDSLKLKGKEINFLVNGENVEFNCSKEVFKLINSELIKNDIEFTSFGNNAKTLNELYFDVSKGE